MNTHKTHRRRKIKKFIPIAWNLGNNEKYNLKDEVFSVKKNKIVQFI